MDNTTWLGIAALGVAVWSAIRQIELERAQATIQQRLLEIEEERHRQEASVRLDVIRTGPYTAKWCVTNDGPAPATDVHAEVHDYKSIVEESKVDFLEAGWHSMTQADLREARGPYTVFVFWRDWSRPEGRKKKFGPVEVGDVREQWRRIVGT